MWAALIPIAISLVSSLVQNKQRKEYQSVLAKQNMSMPSGITDAEMIYQQLANVGLPGAEKIKENIFATAAGNLSQARRTTGGMGDYFEILNNAFTGAEDKASGIDIQDAQMKAGNSAQLAQFLAGVKAPAEQGIQQFDIQKALDMQREKMEGTNNIFQTIESGVGAGMDAYAKKLYLDYSKDYLQASKDSWKTAGADATTPAATTPFMQPMAPASTTPGSVGGSGISSSGGGVNSFPAVSGMNNQMGTYYQVMKTMGWI